MQNFQLSISEFFTQKFSQARVLLDSENARAFRERKLGERSKSRPDFDDVIFVGQIGLLDVSNHSDNGREVGPESHAFADRIFVGPISAG